MLVPRRKSGPLKTARHGVAGTPPDFAILRVRGSWHCHGYHLCFFQRRIVHLGQRRDAVRRWLGGGRTVRGFPATLGFTKLRLFNRLGDGGERVLPKSCLDVLAGRGLMELRLGHGRTQSLERCLATNKVARAG